MGPLLGGMAMLDLNDNDKILLSEIAKSGLSRIKIVLKKR
jgi:hypothetical protein